MSVATVVTQGFGSFGTVNLVVTDGYAAGTEVVQPEVPPVRVRDGGGTPFRFLASLRDDDPLVIKIKDEELVLILSAIVPLLEEERRRLQ